MEVQNIKSEMQNSQIHQGVSHTGANKTGQGHGSGLEGNSDVVRTLKPVTGLKGNFPHLQMSYSFQHFLQQTVPTLRLETKNTGLWASSEVAAPSMTAPLQSCSFLLTATWSLISLLHKIFSPESRAATESLPMTFCVNRAENQPPVSPTATFY